MRIAFEKAGGECVLTCEIDEAAFTTYKANYQPKADHIYHSDVLTLKSQLVPNHDVLIAGFPCQPYSIAGLRRGLQDERGGNMFFAIVRILKDKTPDSFLLENVKGVMNHNHGDTFKFMIESLLRCGYTVQYKVLNSMTHANVPQNRERVFVVGFRDTEKAKQFEYPKETPLTNTIRDCLEGIRVSDEFYYDDRYDCYKEISKAVKSKDTLYQWRRQYVRENKRKVCPTLTANMGSGGHNVPLVLDDYGIRKLTPRETANFQGFPKDFVLPKLANSKLYHQFGNSVTVPLITKIAKQIAEVL